MASLFGFFSKDEKKDLDKGLEKTSDSLFSKLGKAVAGKSTVDDEVLDELEEIKICTSYELNGKKINYFPSNAEDFSKCKPIFETLPGWQCSTANCRNLEDLPKPAMSYLRFLAELMEVPIAIVSLGASREQTIVVEDPIHGPKRALLSS